MYCIAASFSACHHIHEFSWPCIQRRRELEPRRIGGCEDLEVLELGRERRGSDHDDIRDTEFSLLECESSELRVLPGRQEQITNEPPLGVIGPSVS